jgi:hypothetical protein
MNPRTVSRPSPRALRTRGERPPSRWRGARRAVAALLGGVALAVLGLIAAPGLGIVGVVAAPIVAASLACHGLAAARRRRRRRNPDGPAVALRRTDRRRRTGVPLIAAIEVAALVGAAIAGVSWAQAVGQRSNSSLGIRTVEWLRDQGGAGLVSQVESVYYSLTAPAKGGAPLRSLPSVGVASAPPSSPISTAAGHGSGRTHHARQAHHAAQQPAPFRPPRVRPVLHPALRGEGVWTVTQGRFARAPQPPLLVTAYRPQADYPRVVAGVAWFDHQRTRVSLYPGIREPPGAGNVAGQIPTGARRSVLAAFNGGFKHKDSGGGFVSQGRLIEPLVAGQGTIIGMKDGTVDVRTWHGGARPGPSVAFARQNLPLIVDGGRPNPNLNDGPQWGATLGNAILVWRSGVGIDRHGNLLYAAGPSLGVAGLARILIHAGAVRAVELDINSYWVTLNTYGLTGARDARPLLPTMNRSAQRYLTPDDRDFFAVYLK